MELTNLPDVLRALANGQTLIDRFNNDIKLLDEGIYYELTKNEHHPNANNLPYTEKPPYLYEVAEEWAELGGGVWDRTSYLSTEQTLDSRGEQLYKTGRVFKLMPDGPIEVTT